MLHLLAQTYDYSRDYMRTYGGNYGDDGGVSVGLILLGLAFAAVAIVAMWKVFTKAGKPGWAAVIPVYNSWVWAEIAGKPGWWGLYPLVAWIPFLGWGIAIVVSLMIALGVGKNFGKSDAFSVIALWLFSIVGFLILAFGPDKYVGPGAAPKSNAPKSPVAS